MIELSRPIIEATKRREWRDNVSVLTITFHRAVRKTQREGGIWIQLSTFLFKQCPGDLCIVCTLNRHHFFLVTFTDCASLVINAPRELDHWVGRLLHCLASPTT